MDGTRQTRTCSYLFDDIVVDCAGLRVQKGGQPLKITRRAYEVLVYLAEHQGRIVEKQELFDQLWKDKFVTDNALTRVIKEIRQVIGDKADSPRYIETVPKLGYRLIAEVRKAEAPAFLSQRSLSDAAQEGIIAARPISQGEEALKNDKDSSDLSVSRAILQRWIGWPLSLKVLVGFITASALVLLAYGLWARRAAMPMQTPSTTIAVLPFKPLNTESRDESLEMGMAQTLITRLSNIHQLVVRPMGAVRKYTDLQQDPVNAGRELRAEVVLDGSIQKAADHIRVTVRLMNVESGAALWTAQFDENFTDIFKVQDTISERVTQALTLRLSTEERARLTRHHTEDAEAYQLYLHGHYLFGKQTGDSGDNLRKSLEYYQQAIEKDPTFAPAYVGISEFYITDGPNLITLTPQERIPKAKAAVVKALELDDSSAEAHNAMAELKYQYEFDWTGAEDDFKRAIDLNPNVAYIHLAFGWYLMCAGRFDQAQVEMEKAQEQDPGSLQINRARGMLLLYRRQYDGAIRHYQRMREVEPNGHRTNLAMSVAYEQMGMYPEAVEEFLESGRFIGSLRPEDIEALRKAFKVSGWQGYLRQRIRLLDEKSNREYVSPLKWAMIYALLAEKESAFAWLEKGIAAHDPAITKIRIEPAYDSLRSDPRFTTLLQRMNITP